MNICIEAKSLLIGLQSVLMGTYISIWYRFIYFLLPLIPTIDQMTYFPIRISPNILFPGVDESHTHFMFYCKLSKTARTDQIN